MSSLCLKIKLAVIRRCLNSWQHSALLSWKLSQRWSFYMYIPISVIIRLPSETFAHLFLVGSRTRIWPNIIKIFKYWKGLRKSAQPQTSCKSFQTVSESLEDTLTSVKLGFFSFIASHIEPFLVNYQTDQLMVPFLHDDLTSICCKLLELIVKPSLI